MSLKTKIVTFGLIFLVSLTAFANFFIPQKAEADNSCPVISLSPHTTEVSAQTNVQLTWYTPACQAISDKGLPFKINVIYPGNPTGYNAGDTGGQFPLTGNHAITVDTTFTVQTIDTTNGTVIGSVDILVKALAVDTSLYAPAITVTGTAGSTTNMCKALVKWTPNTPAGTHNLTYNVQVGSNPAVTNLTSTNYTSSDVPCSGGISVSVKEYSSGRLIGQNFTTADVQPDQITTGSGAGAGDANGTGGTSSNPDANSPGSACSANCKNNIWGWFAPTEQIKDMLCQLQCTIVDLIAQTLAQAFNSMVLPNLL